MSTNIGTLDRILRLLLAVVALYLGFVVYMGSALGIALTIAGAVFGLTAIVGLCPLYRLLGIRTCQIRN
ncbi:YgaP family membrane protein [Trichothermofontia sp.]